MPNCKSLTVVICTHNRAELLKRTLYELNNADRPRSSDVEILVIANACNDDTASVLEAYQSNQKEKGWFELRWVKEEKAGKSHALNRAISLLGGAMVAFVDDDHRVDKKYLVNICRAAKSHPEITIFCGRIIPDWDGREPTWVHDRGPYRVYPLPIPRFDQGDKSYEIQPGGAVPGGGNLFLRRSVFDRVGGFSPKLGPRRHDLRGGEDSDFVIRALGVGERLRYVPYVKQYHYVDPSRLRMTYLIKKSYQRSRVTSQIRTHQERAIPAYMWRKLSANLLRAVFSLDYRKKRFYVVRTAATLGEIKGIWDSGK
jgi:GT2 family glycosyltransferase